jgi:hypothetical protein
MTGESGISFLSVQSKDDGCGSVAPCSTYWSNARRVPESGYRLTILIGSAGPPSCRQLVMVPANIAAICPAVRLAVRVSRLATTVKVITPTGVPYSGL